MKEIVFKRVDWLKNLLELQLGFIQVNLNPNHSCLVSRIILFSLYLGRHVDAPFEIMRIFAEAGGNPEKACVGHIESKVFHEVFANNHIVSYITILGTLSNPDLLLEFADEFNCYNQFDLFGTENSYYQFQQSLDFPNDATRMVLINCLINGGFDDRILVSHDIHTKHRLVIT